IVAALASLPLLAIDNVTSTDSDDADSIEVAAARTWDGDRVVERLAHRAPRWSRLREDRRVKALDEATASAIRAAANEAQRLEQAERAAEAELRAAEEAKQEAAARRAADALRKAQDAARQAAARPTPRQGASPSPGARASAPVAPRAGEPTGEQWARLRAC